MVKNAPANAGDTRDEGLIPGSGRSPGEGTYFSTLAWEIPWTEEPGGLLSVESQRTEHNLETKQHQLQQMHVRNL